MNNTNRLTMVNTREKYKAISSLLTTRSRIQVLLDSSSYSYVFSYALVGEALGYPFEGHPSTEQCDKIMMD